MITVVDQVRPWLTPSSTLAATTQPQFGAQISSGGIGSADQPARRPAPACGRTGPTACLSEEVGDRLDHAERQDERQRAAVNAARWKACSASSGTTVRSWPSMPPTSALTATSRRELGQVGAQASRTPAWRGAVAGAGCTAGGTASRGGHACSSSAAGGVRPVGRAAGQDRHGGVPGAFQQAGGGGGPLAVPAHGHHLGPPLARPGVAGRAELDVAGAGQVPGGVFDWPAGRR